MSTLTKKTVQTAMHSCHVSHDQLRMRAGKVEVRRAYFYTHGMTAEKFAAQVAQACKDCGISVSVEGRDDYANWPKTSYFTAVVEAR